ncbi:hypothetical protein ZWY2020_032343 [Hordeum vulgare]|nr:hypothetical protein ZWY2020_032343 [Hordeum vulgare]
MEEWRNLALAAAGESLANTMTRHMGVAEAIARAGQQNRLAAEECRGFGQGVHPTPNAGERASAGGDFVDLAIDRIKSISRFHAVRGIGLHGDEARHAETAMLSLRSAKSHGHAALRVFERMLRPPSPQAVARAWAPAAEQLLRRAINNLDMAAASVGRIRPAIVVEYKYARKLLNASI